MLGFRDLGASFSIGASFSRFGCFVLRSSFSKLPTKGFTFIVNCRLRNMVHGREGGSFPGGVLPYITYTGMCRPTGS